MYIDRGYQRGVLSGDWLGAGLYFWLDAPAKAREWGHHVTGGGVGKSSTSRGDDVTVMMAELQFNEHWIDLLESGPWLERFRDAARKLEALGLLPRQTSNLAASALHYRDCALIEETINAAARAGYRVDAIRCAFLEGSPVAPDSAIYDKSHVQIAVRNPNVILRTALMDNTAELPAEG